MAQGCVFAKSGWEIAGIRGWTHLDVWHREQNAHRVLERSRLAWPGRFGVPGLQAAIGATRQDFASLTKLMGCIGPLCGLVLHHWSELSSMLRDEKKKRNFWERKIKEQDKLKKKRKKERGKKINHIMVWNSCIGNSVKSSRKKLLICHCEGTEQQYKYKHTTASRHLQEEAECFSNSLLLIAGVCSEICLSLFHWDVNEHKEVAKTDKARKGDVCCDCEKLRQNGRIPCSLFQGVHFRW